MPLTAAAVLTASDLSVELAGLPVLRGVSLTMAAGETVALMGSNGSGKSTLVRSILGLHPLQRGAVELFGTPLGRFHSWARVGYVPQRSPAPLGRAKVKEIVASGRLARRRPFVPPSRADRAAVTRALALVGLTERAGAELMHLSGGQQQRVLIARALAGEPELLILDEPTAGVDLEHQERLLATLSELVGAGVAVLVVLHELGGLAEVIERAVVLRDGRVAYDGGLALLASEFAVGRHEHEPPTTPRRLLDGAVER